MKLGRLMSEHCIYPGRDTIPQLAFKIQSEHSEYRYIGQGQKGNMARDLSSLFLSFYLSAGVELRHGRHYLFCSCLCLFNSYFKPSKILLTLDIVCFPEQGHSTSVLSIFFQCAQCSKILAKTEKVQGRNQRNIKTSVIIMLSGQLSHLSKKRTESQSLPS